MVGQDPTYVSLLAKLQKISAYDEPVLIIGESGSGKESLAQALYLLGPRRGQPYVSVNCPQYQDGNLTVSELFGHRQGQLHRRHRRPQGVLRDRRRRRRSSSTRSRTCT